MRNGSILYIGVDCQVSWSRSFILIFFQLDSIVRPIIMWWLVPIKVEQTDDRTTLFVVGEPRFRWIFSWVFAFSLLRIVLPMAFARTTGSTSDIQFYRGRKLCMFRLSGVWNLPSLHDFKPNQTFSSVTDPRDYNELDHIFLVAVRILWFCHCPFSTTTTRSIHRLGIIIMIIPNSYQWIALGTSQGVKC